jgi:CHAT domain-containing protein
MPTTPGLRTLLGTRAETDAIRRYLPQALVYATDAETNVRLPTRSEILASLPGRSIAHFACHAITDHANPARSGLLLADYSIAPLTVADLATIDLDDARLAYLSACTTASSRAPHLLDEAIHLASGFQLAGFPQVIGTLWDIHDSTAARIAETFYTRLAKLGAQGTQLGRPAALDTTQAAVALHAAICDLRRVVRGLPSLWAAYVHAGA